MASLGLLCHYDYFGRMATTERPVFFVPDVPPEKQEEVYSEFAAAHVPVPPMGERIYSTTFTHDGEAWIATVGRQLRGSVMRTQTRRGNKVERSMQRSNSSVVLAIFPGVPCLARHNGASGTWANPLLVGEPCTVVCFASAGE